MRIAYADPPYLLCPRLDGGSSCLPHLTRRHWPCPRAGRRNQLPFFGTEMLPVNPPSGGVIVTPGCFTSEKS
jgi:hypothetical protein